MSRQSSNLTRAFSTIIRDVHKKHQRGWFLVSAIVMILFLTAVGLSIAQLVGIQYQHTSRESFDQNAQLVSEAGIEQSVAQLNTNDTFAGYTTPQQYFSNTTQGKATFASTITTNSDGSKTIVSTGLLYHSPSATSPYITKKVRVIVVGTSSSGYSVYGGPGGLILTGSANVTNSSLYIGGTISMSGASKIGTASNPVTVNVANDACPTGASPGPTFPQVCSGTQPISLAQSTNIYGTVCATGQISKGPNNNIQGGNGGAGLEAGCTAPVASLPSYDRQGQINAVTTTGAGNNNTYVCNSFPFNRSWPANLKLTGNVSIGGSCNVTVNGNVYITGNLTINGASKLTVANTVGGTRPVILVDGTITVGGSATMIANSSGTGMEFISFQSTAPCNPGCTSVTGNDLKNSQGQQTVSVSGASSLPGMIFDAYWGEASISGSGTMGSAIGQTVNLSGAGTIIFGTTLATGSKTWKITSYQPLY